MSRLPCGRSSFLLLSMALPKSISPLPVQSSITWGCVYLLLLAHCCNNCCSVCIMRDQLRLYLPSTNKLWNIANSISKKERKSGATESFCLLLHQSVRDPDQTRDNKFASKFCRLNSTLETVYAVQESLWSFCFHSAAICKSTKEARRYSSVVECSLVQVRVFYAWRAIKSASSLSLSLLEQVTNERNPLMIMTTSTMMIQPPTKRDGIFISTPWFLPAAQSLYNDDDDNIWMKNLNPL